MRAVIVTPREPSSGRLAEVPDPQPRDGEVLVQVHQVGLDGTDAEILQGQYGEAPPGDDYLIIGHESLGRVEKVMGGATGLSPGDRVVAIVRREPELTETITGTTAVRGTFMTRVGR